MEKEPSGPKSRGNVTARLVFSLFLLFLIGLSFVIPGFQPAERIAFRAVFGFVCAFVAAGAYLELKDSGTRGKASSLAGICFWLSLCFIAYPLFLEVKGGFAGRSPTHRISCANLLKQMGLILDIYADDHGGAFPPIDDTKNNFIFEGDTMFPDYLTDVDIIRCGLERDHRNIARLVSNEHHPESQVGRAHADCITDRSFIYLGWLVSSDQEAEAFFEAYDRLAPDELDKDIVVPEGRGNAGGNVLHRLDWNVDRVLVDSESAVAEMMKLPVRERTLDANGESKIPSVPIIWERPFLDLKRFKHEPAGGNVLYLDGHTEYVRFGENFPMTETMARLLDERPRALIPDCE